MRGMALGLVAMLLCFGAVGTAWSEDGDDPVARKARIEKARRELAAEKEEFDRRVNEAIERGAAWLAKQQRRDGSYPGFSDDLKPRQYSIMEVGLDALVILTLAHCGVGPKEDSVKRCLQFCRKHYSGDPTKGSLDLKGSGKLTIYTAATLILALDALYNPGGEKLAKIKRDRYGRAIAPKPTKCKYPKSTRRWIQELVAFIVDNQVKPAGGWRYPGNPLDAPEGDTDLSNTQYALLALDAAARCGIEAPPETWLAAAEYVLTTQDTDGLDISIWVENESWEPGTETPRFVEMGQTRARGWAYVPGGMELPTGSMTTAGVTCLAMIKERLWVLKKLAPPLRKRLDRGMIDGLGWLADNWSVSENPTPGGASMWHYYFLYGLERTGSKVGTRWVGQHDWYREGGEHLLSAQEKHGGWAEAGATGKPADATESAITQTCFALLFLKRSTRKPFVPMMPPITNEGGAPRDGR